MNANENKINEIGKILKFNTKGSKDMSGEVEIISKLGEGSSGEVFLGRGTLRENTALDLTQRKMQHMQHKQALNKIANTHCSDLSESRTHNIEVAVKILRPALVSTPMEERFSRESVLLCSLSHPAIVKGIASGCAQFDPAFVDIPRVSEYSVHNEHDAQSASVERGARGPHNTCKSPNQLHTVNPVNPQVYRSKTPLSLPFLIMENIKGTSLATLMYKGKLSIKDAIQITVDIAGALEHIRLDGRVLAHRDIKPANIMILPDGSPKLMDLGVARTMVKVKSALETQIAGTLHYMAPEQIAASSEADIRSDIFSLGLVLFEMLGGKLASDERETLALRMSGTALDLDSLSVFKWQALNKGRRGENLSEGAIFALKSILLKMCAFEPSERYQTPRQVAFDLTRVLNGAYSTNLLLNQSEELLMEQAQNLASKRPDANVDAKCRTQENWVNKSSNNLQSNERTYKNLSYNTGGSRNINQTQATKQSTHENLSLTKNTKTKKKSQRIIAVILIIILAVALLTATTGLPHISTINDSATPISYPLKNNAPPKGTDIVIPIGANRLI